MAASEIRTLWCFSIGPRMPRSMSQHCSTSGSPIWIGWKRRVSAGSFSIYWRYSDQVVAAMVRSVPRASAGLSRLAASPVPAAPPAPIRVCASSMNRMIGVGDSCTSSITERRPLLEFALHRGAGLHQADIERAQPHAAQRRRHVARGDALREALDHRGLADAGLAGEDRIVLAPPHQDVDDLADFVVAAEDRVHFAGFRLGREILGKAVERRRALLAGPAARRPACPRRRGPSRPSGAGSPPRSPPKSCGAHW